MRWHEEGERNTKHFYSLEKRHHDVKTVSKLKVGENYYIEDQIEILEEEKSFTRRYTAPPISTPKISKTCHFLTQKT